MIMALRRQFNLSEVNSNMAIEYSGNVWTAEEIIRMRERETRDDMLRLTINQMISEVGIDNVVWALKTIAHREAVFCLEDEASIKRDRHISKFSVLEEALEGVEEAFADIDTREYD